MNRQPSAPFFPRPHLPPIPNANPNFNFHPPPIAPAHPPPPPPPAPAHPPPPPPPAPAHPPPPPPHHHHHHHQNFSQHPGFPPSVPPFRNLSTTLSSLKTLIAFSEQTLESLSRTLHLGELSPDGKGRNVDAVACPFNPRHLMQPESLFHHYLRCPPAVDATHLLEDLNYPRSFESSSEPQHEGNSVQSGGNPDSADLCLSLGDYAEIRPSFFYKDCPGAVTFSDLDRLKKPVALPAVISKECAGSAVSVDEKHVSVLSEKEFQVLPSDFLAVKKEVDAWGDYPRSYSFNVLCALLGSKRLGYGELKKWIIAQSPRYGVVLDIRMSDHIFLLFRLCLKAIVKEAFSYAEAVLGDGDLKGNRQNVGLRNKGFDCSVLVQVLIWLASQFSVLYGELHGKFFGINMFKKFVLESTRRLMLFQPERKASENPKAIESFKRNGIGGMAVNDVKLEEPPESSGFCKVKESDDVHDSPICVSNVAAAILALHERSILEEKLRALKFAAPPIRNQRAAEHDSVTRRASEERSRRSNYRPVVEYDGIPRQKAANQEANRAKTREEILAEERDYKRRRMSYRGKKVKRTPLEITRDIINQYTEEIRLAGEPGEGSKGEGMVPPKPVRVQAEKEKHQGHSTTSTTADATQPKAFEQPTRDHHTHHEESVNSARSIDRETKERNYDSGHSLRLKSHDRSYKHSDRCIDHDDGQYRRSKHHSSKRWSSSYDRRTSHSSTEDRRYRKRYDESNLKKAFDDRYVPSE